MRKSQPGFELGEGHSRWREPAGTKTDGREVDVSIGGAAALLESLPASWPGAGGR